LSQAKNVLFLALGHLANDSLYSSLPPLLPILIATYGLSTALVGVLPALYMVVASFLQPIFGQVYDRRNLTWLMSLGLVMGGAAVASIGYVGSYTSILMAAVVGGLGSALFHPVATSLSSRQLSHGRASSVSLFMLGGNLGLSLGPLIIVSTIASINIRGTFIALILPLIAATILFRFRGDIGSTRRDTRSGGRVDRRALSLVLLASVLRGTATITLITYLPLYLTWQGLPLGMGGLMLSTMLLAGGAGMVVAGLVADRFDRIHVASAILLISAPVLLAFTMAPIQAMWVLAALMGFTLMAAHPILVVIAQELLPGRTGLASALIYGVAFGVSNLTTPFIGLAIDAIGFQRTFETLTILPIIGGILTILTARAKKHIHETAG
jgi:FSR family fosmidomycin resistance protein-like MFS transporter